MFSITSSVGNDSTGGVGITIGGSIDGIVGFIGTISAGLE